MIIEVQSEQAMKALGEKLGSLFRGGEVLELVGDVGAGKTTLTKGIARGLGISDEVSSPSYTILQAYNARDGLTLAHYDFYRLDDAGIMANELEETIHDGSVVTVIEWAKIVGGVLPAGTIHISITAPTENSRTLTIDGPAALQELLS